MYTYCKKKMESTLLKEYRDLLKQHKAFPNDLWSRRIISLSNRIVRNQWHHERYGGVPFEGWVYGSPNPTREHLSS